MLATIKGLLDKYQSTMVKGAQDKTLRKCYHELFSKKDEKKKGELIKTFLVGQNAKKEAKDNGVEENIRTEKVKFTTENPIPRTHSEHR